LVGGDDADVEGDLRAPAHRPGSSLLERAQELCLEAERHVSDLVEKQGTALRLEQEPAVVLPRVGEGAAHVSEQLALEQMLGESRAVDRDEGPLGATASLVQRSRHEFLARTTLAGDEHRRIAFRDALDDLIDALHFRTRPEQVVERAGSRDGGPQALHLFTELVMLERAIQRYDDGIHVERLRDEVVSTGPDRRDRGVHAPVSGDDDDRNVRTIRHDPLAELYSGGRAEVQIGDHDAEVFSLHGRERRRGASDGDRSEVFQPKPLLEERRHRVIIFDDQDSPHAGSPFGSRISKQLP
jgi:hypothetical protein